MLTYLIRNILKTPAIKSFFTLKPVRTNNADKKTSILLSIAIIITQIGDYASTRIGLLVGANEGNGTMAQFIAKYGFNAFFNLKIAAALFLAWTCWKRPFVASAVVLLYTVVIVHNLFVILRFVG